MKEQIIIVNRHPKLAISRPYLKKKTSHILSKLGLKDCGVEITLVEDDFMMDQNKKFMGKKCTTDVLSFPHIHHQKKNRKDFSEYQSKYLGDVLISLDQAQRQADEQKIKLQVEVLFLIMHSILHLVGYDHATKKERLHMQKLESQIWMEVLIDNVL